MTWRGDGSTIALGNKDDIVAFVDYKTHKVVSEKQADFEVNEIAWSADERHFYMSSGKWEHVLLSIDIMVSSVHNRWVGGCIIKQKKFKSNKR